MKPKDAQRPDHHITVFQITPPRAFRYDTLVIAVGSVTNDFGTPGASQYAVPLETPVQAMRFNRRLVNADESPTVIDGIRPRKSGSQLTPRWRETDSNPWSLAERPALGRVSKKSVEHQLDAKDEAWPTARQRSQAMLPFTRARNLTSPQRPTVG